MGREILERMESILKEEGFTHLSIHAGSHSWTLSGNREGLRAVVHLTDREEPAHRSEAIEQVSEPADLSVKAVRMRPETGQAIQAGGGTSLHTGEQTTQRGRSRKR
jgi:hypothetical protein